MFTASFIQIIWPAAWTSVLSSHWGSHFFERHTRLFVEPAIWALSFVGLVTTKLLQSRNKMHLKYVFHSKFRMMMPISWIKNNFIKFQKQSFADVFQNWYSLKFCNSQKKTPVKSYFLIKLQACRSAILRLQHRCVLVNITKFLRTPILKNIRERLLLYPNHKVTIWASLLNQKYDVGWFLLRGFVDLVRLYSLLIIIRNHFNTVLSLDLQKNYLMSILMVCKQTGGEIFKDTLFSFYGTPAADCFWNSYSIFS